MLSIRPAEMIIQTVVSGGGRRPLYEVWGGRMIATILGQPEIRYQSPHVIRNWVKQRAAVRQAYREKLEEVTKERLQLENKNSSKNLQKIPPQQNKTKGKD